LENANQRVWWGIAYRFLDIERVYFVDGKLLSLSPLGAKFHPPDRPAEVYHSKPFPPMNLNDVCPQYYY
jgi:hypothetical protein